MTSPTRRSFRVVAAGDQVPLVLDLLREQGFRFENEPFFPLAFRLLDEPFPLGRSLAAFFGYIYIQDRASMLPPLALNPPVGGTVLDLCASPGSKTGLLAQLVGENGLVLGNEPNPSRLATLRRNLQQLNLLQTVTCCHPGETLPLPEAHLDSILLDPPCSGWGTTDRHPQVLKLWQGDKVAPLIRLQRALLEKAALLLRPGGRLVYSTCTTNPDENEAQVCFARDQLGLIPVAIPPLPGFRYEEAALPGVDGVLRVDEDASDSQGFFVAAFTRTGEPSPRSASGGTAGSWTPVSPDDLRSGGLDPQRMPPGRAGLFRDTVHLLPARALEELPPALRWQGLVLGRFAGGEFRASGRMHACLIHPSDRVPRLDIDDLDTLRALIQGRNVPVTAAGKQARLYWRDLPLGLVTLKSGRALWSDR